MTSREPMEPIDEEVGVLGDLEDVSESEHTQETMDHTDEEKGENPDQRVSPKEPVVPDLLLDQMYLQRMYYINNDILIFFT